MKKAKKILSLVLSVLMCISIVPLSDLSVEASALTWGDYEYAVLEDGTVEITNYNGNAKELIIPSEIDGKAVTRIGKWQNGMNYSSPFYDCNTLVDVIIPEGVTHIAPYAFAYCNNLENIKIPYSLTKLGWVAFYGTPFYDSGEWVDNFYVIDGCAVNFDFSNVVSRELYIPAGIKVIAEQLFATDIPMWTFFEVDENNLYYSSDEYGVLFDKNKTKLILYPDASKTREYIVPETVKSIERLFAWYLETIFVPDCVTDISMLASLSFKDVYIYGDNTAIDNDSYLCYTNIKYDEWISCRDEFAALCDTYILKAVNGTISPEEELFFAKLEEYFDIFSRYDEDAPYGTIHCYPGSTAEAYGKSKNINCEYIIDDIKIKDETTSITAEFAPDTFAAEVEMVIEESSENADLAFKGLFGSYKSYDISFLSDGAEVQPNGKVTIKIPVSFIADINAIKVYHVDDAGNATLINSNYENGYIIFETDHFSEYVIVDESSKIETPTEPEVPDEPTAEPDEPTTEPEEPDTPTDPTDPCSCNCHKGGIKAFFFKLFNFFAKLFNPAKRICGCGVKH